MKISKTRFLLVTTIAALAVAACSGDSGETTTTIGIDTTLAGALVPSSTSTTTTSVSGSSTTTLDTTPPVAWIAPSGVVLAVVNAEGGLVEVITPCGDPATLAEGTPVRSVDVLLDPGHGGPVDTGAVAPTGLAEKEVNLDVSRRAAELLNDRGISTLLTRTGDYPIPIRTRAEYADRMGVRAVVSIPTTTLPWPPRRTFPGWRYSCRWRHPSLLDLADCSLRRPWLRFPSSMSTGIARRTPES